VVLVARGQFRHAGMFRAAIWLEIHHWHSGVARGPYPIYTALHARVDFRAPSYPLWLFRNPGECPPTQFSSLALRRSKAAITIASPTKGRGKHARQARRARVPCVRGRPAKKGRRRAPRDIHRPGLIALSYGVIAALGAKNFRAEGDLAPGCPGWAGPERVTWPLRLEP